jgi:general secretion pathway protein G
MLLPYSDSSTRRSIFWTLLVVVVATGVFIPLCFLRAHDAIIPAFLALGSSVIAMTLLCIWCAVYVRDEPRLVRIALVSGAVFFLLLTVVVLWAAFTSPAIVLTKQMRVQADIQGIRTMLSCIKGTSGYYPSTDEGLNVLVPRLMEELPTDAWGTPYVYRQPGKRYPNAYDLFSAGPDRVADTPDDDWGK